MNELTQLLDDYAPSNEVVSIVRSSQLLFVVGISGAGKNTIINKLLKSGKYHRIISHTTRAPRENYGVMEQDGEEYYFVNHAQVADMVNAKEFVEAKQYGINVYGTSAAELTKAKQEGKIALADIEVQGAQEYWQLSQDIQVVFIVPPSFEIWQDRLLSRYKHGIDEEDIMRRKRIAVEEIELALSKDYFKFVVNDELDRAVEAVDALAHGAKSGEEYQAKGMHIARELAEELKT
jgi:guanylate kinase